MAAAGWYEDYYDLERLALAEQPVKVQFEVAASKLGYLDPSGLAHLTSEKGNTVLSEEEDSDFEDSDEAESSDNEDAYRSDHSLDAPNDADGKSPVSRSKFHIPGEPRPSQRRSNTQQRRRRDVEKHHAHIPDLPKGASIEVPFWMGSTLARRGFASAQTPAIFGERVRNELTADPRAGKLAPWNGHFFLLGHAVASLEGDRMLQAVLIQAYSARSWNLVDAANNNLSGGGAHTHLVKTMDSLEATVYLCSLRNARAFQQWQERSAQTIRMSRLAARVAGSKRVRADRLLQPFGSVAANANASARAPTKRAAL
ncbi:DNA replication complex GINS protein psf3 [Porphyridium purpureum]|uniref:DNA replication complex GINS protein psf3 n=1 Tax=Porphyridium purpureum TaxID=35688 RepID=A0A5J4YK87_PORPP|nr:DNA replication complex GINS protein psf3 [Porphyridium purpureum]|eukprot:POR1135..scf244_11